MEAKLREQHDLIQHQISELQQLQFFCINNYTYHHNNDELAVLQELFKMQKCAHKIFESFQVKLNEMKETLAAANCKGEEVDKMLQAKGLLKGPITEQRNNCDSSEDEKENVDKIKQERTH